MNDAVGDGFLRLIDEEAGDLGETLSEGRTFTTRTAAGTAVQGSAVGPTAAATRAASPRTWILRPGDLDARLDVHSKWEIP